MCNEQALIDPEQMKILYNAIQNGTINLEHIQEQEEMKQREEILSKHNHNITLGNDGNWWTRIDDASRKSGYRQIKRKRREDLEDFLVSFYKAIPEKLPTFKDIYDLWLKTQSELVEDNSVSKYRTDYKRFFEGTEFENMPIYAITEETIKVFICQKTKEHKLPKRSCRQLFGYIRHAFHSAEVNKKIKPFDNPTLYLEAKMFYKYCVEKSKTTEERTFSDQEMLLLHRQFQEDHRKKTGYIPIYALELAALTGMRVGELAALRWENIKDEYILIDSSEKCNRITKEYSVSTTKTDKSRAFPLTQEIRKLLTDIKRVEMKYGYICEWVFANEKGRIHASVISSCLKNKCKQIGICAKGVHTMRRTLNSKLIGNGMTPLMASSILGHTEEVNRAHYTYDMSSMDEKNREVTEIHKKMYTS